MYVEGSQNAVEEMENVQSENDILADFPFWGTLMRIDEESGEPKFMMHIKRGAAVRISELQKRQLRKGGDFVLRISDGTEKREITFGIEREESAKPATLPVQSPIDTETLRLKIKEEIRGDYANRINNLEAEANRYARENSELRNQLAQAVSSVSTEKFQLISAHNAEIQNRIAEIAGLKQELAIANLRAELQGVPPEDVKEDESGVERILKLVGPYLGPVLAQFTGGTPTPPAQLAAPAALKAVPLPNPAPVMPAQEQNAPSAEEIMANLAETFRTSALDLSFRALNLENPLAKSISDGFQTLANQFLDAGYVPTNDDWTEVAKGAVSRAVELNATPDKVAKVIAPMVTRIDGVSTVLDYMPANVAVNMLEKFTGALPAPAKILLTNAIEAYKNLTKAA